MLGHSFSLLCLSIRLCHSILLLLSEHELGQCQTCTTHGASMLSSSRGGLVCHWLTAGGAVVSNPANICHALLVLSCSTDVLQDKLQLLLQ